MRALLLSALVATLGPHGIGSVHFGETKSQAVSQLTALFGAPTSRGPNTGCSPRYTEVAWGGLSAEFRSRVFSGYRYWHAPSPRLETANGVTLGTTLGRARAAYGGLKRRGTILWQAPNGLVLVDDSRGDPASPSDRIVEIKIGTCGDF